MRQILISLGISVAVGMANAAQIAPITLPSAKSTVFTITRSDDLWFFNGATPSNYSTTIQIKAVGPSLGKFTWTVTSNQRAVKLENGQSTITKQDDPTLNVTSAEISLGSQDVTLDFVYNGNDVGNYPLTVFAPQSATLTNEPVDSTFTVLGVPLGFSTKASFSVVDHFGNPLPKPVIGNESFDTNLRVDDTPNVLWAIGVTGNSFSINITDLWQQSQLPLKSPEPQPPQTPLSGTTVFHVPQRYFLGSTTPGAGRQVEVHSLQYYVDHARALPLQ